MVIIGKKFGRLANRLWIFSYFAANAIEYNYRLLYRNFDEFIWYFEATRSNRFSNYPIRARIIRLIPLDYFLYWFMQAIIESVKNIKPIFSFYTIKKVKKAGDGYDLNNDEFVHDAKNRLVITRDGGFYFKDNRNLRKHKKLILDFFKPIRKYQCNIDNHIIKCRHDVDTLIGVHLRKGDYRRFVKGQWFYPNQIYARIMHAMMELLTNRSSKIRFLLVSDEKIINEDFEDLDIVTGTGHFIEDLYILTKCDYLIGPPSTYTLWSSFYGDVPLWFIENNESMPVLEDFFIASDIGQYTRLQEKYEQMSID